ncbi:hypothetical protein CSB45_02075 [candidate division KSB3 bacterium]|uniref:Histidine phosphatase family protein n=1 Tax=candidate division KSB3 bacterium TaxID=2044937 RepID=A0A2G6E9Q9_9BACT|nr:MAG: hypothetical protein CSB45_02075 [candidate division KSB3 bacterium]PIE30870.1 MAG: hypothetical protein CSA57_00685 [candidate division KSB3 bacterium]
MCLVMTLDFSIMNTTTHDVHSRSEHVSELNVLKDGILADYQRGDIFLRDARVTLQFPMMLVRHGQTDGNLRRTFQGQIDGPENQLNALGRVQAQEAAKQVYECLAELSGPALKEFAVSGRLRILSSPLTRAQDTCRAFTDYFERRSGVALKATLENRLTEMFFGAIEGKSTEEIDDEKLRGDTLRFREQDALVDWQGSGESFLDVMYRSKELLEQLNAEWADKGVLAVAFAHGTLINALRSVVGDKKLIGDNGLIAFRNDIVENAKPFWLGNSELLAQSVTAHLLERGTH